MEHRDKISKEQSTKEIFLQNSLAELDKPVVYSLEAEFAGTKKNRDLKPYLIFFWFVFLVIISTVVTVNYLEVRSRQIKIDISDFEDIRLKETLSDAMEQGKELKDLRSSYNTDLQQIKKRIQREADLKNADKKALQRLEQVPESEYQRKYAEKQEEIAQLRQQIKDNAASSKDKNNDARILQQKLENCQYGLNNYLNVKRALGCVLNPDRWEMEVFIFREKKIRDVITVDLYRGEGKYIGKLKLTPNKNGLQVEIVELAKNQSVQALDWFRSMEG